MEGAFFGGMRGYFSKKGYATKEEALNYLNADFRWLRCSEDTNDTINMEYDTAAGEEQEIRIDNEYATYSSQYNRPLRDCTTATEIEKLYRPDLSALKAPDFAQARKRWPNHALVLMPTWMPLFCGACEMFGMEEALCGFYTAPSAMEAFLEIRNNAFLEMLERVLNECGDNVDIVWLGDDYASERSLIISLEMWRQFIKPQLIKQADLVKKYGKKILFHCCGAVSGLYPDWIDMGIDCHLVFQTTAANMDANRIAREFGGKIAFYGGMDVQRLLVCGTPEMVRQEVAKNIKAFEHCGGYIVANSHHGLPDIRPDLIEVMMGAAAKHR